MRRESERRRAGATRSGHASAASAYPPIARFIQADAALLFGFVLVALFIWFAENVGTFTGTWLYPRRMAHWTMVPISKLSSWFMLMIVSYTLVAWVNGIETVAERDAPSPAPRPS